MERKSALLRQTPSYTPFRAFRNRLTLVAFKQKFRYFVKTKPNSLIQIVWLKDGTIYVLPVSLLLCRNTNTKKSRIF